MSEQKRGRRGKSYLKFTRTDDMDRISRLEGSRIEELRMTDVTIIVYQVYTLGEGYKRVPLVQRGHRCKHPGHMELD